MEDKNEIVEWYLKNKILYKTLSKKVESIIVELMEIGNIDYHVTHSREKEINSFVKKIERKEYSNPAVEMTDLAGIRIITYVESEIVPIRKIIEENFNIDWDKSSDKSEELGIDKVGYKSVHYVAKLNTDRSGLPEYHRLKDMFFEIQIRTILQHAWAEIEHDRNYKYSGVLPKDIQRKFMLLSGLLETADSEFNSISASIDKISDTVNSETRKGNLNIPINSTSLKEYLPIKFKSNIGKTLNSYFISIDREVKVVNELIKFGYKNLEDLDKDIPVNFSKNLNKFKFEFNYNHILTHIMIIKDYDKFFREVYNVDHWVVLSIPSANFLKQYYNIPVETFPEKYKIKLAKQINK